MDVLAPDAGCKQIEADGRTYTADRSGIFRGVPDSTARKMIRGGNAAAAGVGFTQARARVCTACGFRSLFTTCSRCGGVCLPECRHGDPTCPCQDGDPCHYERYGDSPAMACTHCGADFDGITAELAEHSGTYDHTLNYRADGTWYCETCETT